MNRPDRAAVLAEPAGPRLDCWVCEFVRGWKPTGCSGGDLGYLAEEEVLLYVHGGRDVEDASKGTWNPSRSIADAWSLFEDRRKQVFSKRTAFFRELGGLLQRQPGMTPGLVVAWPDAMMYLSPEAICRAALLAVLEASP